MLETEFLKLKYHANVESNTDEVDAEEYFNNNYKKIDANAKKNYEDLTKLKEDLEQENNELSENMPWNTTQGKSLHITDSAKYSKNRLEVSGDLEQEKRSGYNKLKIKDDTVTSKGITSVAKDEVLNIKGTTESDWFNITSDTNKIDLSFKANTTHKLKLNKSLPTKAILVLRMYEEGSSSVTQSVKIENSNTNVAFTTSKDLSKGYFFVYGYTAGETVNITDLQMMITEGTEDKPYEKYGATPSTEFPSMPVVCTGVQKIRQFGKNFIPYPYTDSTMTARGINYVSNSNGSISISGTSNSNVADFYLFGNSTDNGNYLHLKQDTYSLKDTGNTNIIYIAREKTLGVLVGINTILQALKTQDCYFYGFFVRVNNGATVNTVIYPQLALGNTDYEPYWEQIHTLNLGTTELCAIKDTNGNVVAQDRHVFRNGKWQWEKKIKKRVLNGTENWTDDTVSTVNHFRGKLDNLTYSKTNNAYCDKFICRTSEAHGEWEYIYIIGKACFINIDNTKLTEVSLNGFKTWLSNNNVTVYYVLATPEYIDCTAEQSAILDKLYNNFALQKGTNNIIVESENGVGVNMDLTYMQDLQTKLNLLEAMCVSNASQEV